MEHPVTDTDDTPLRHEVRYYMATYSPIPEILPRVRDALSRMSETGRQQEFKRIEEMPALAAWLDALTAPEVTA